MSEGMVRCLSNEANLKKELQKEMKKLKKQMESEDKITNAAKKLKNYLRGDTHE